MHLIILIGWYFFCALLIMMVLGTMHGITHSKFRGEDGDETTEVGYEEDSVGRNLHEYEEKTNDYVDEPHITVASGAGASVG
jgi:hypothetical protein